MSSLPTARSDLVPDEDSYSAALVKQDEQYSNDSSAQDPCKKVTDQEVMKTYRFKLFPFTSINMRT